MRFLALACVTSVLSLSSLSLQAQDTAVEEDAALERAVVQEEIVIEAKRNLGRQVQKGFAAFRAGDYEKAESYFYRVRARHQLQASITFQAFNDMWNVNMPTGARDVHSAASDREVRKALAIIYYMEGMSQQAQGEDMSARRSFLRAINMNPQHFDARADLSLVEIARGKTSAAEKHILRLAKDVQSCDAVDDAGHCAAVQDRLLQVEMAYGNAVVG